ncbi:MAG: energy-coupling factor ABC transporter ATP-binding protein [bacterium]
MDYSGNSPLIKLKNISFAYPGRDFVLRDIDFEFYKGERLSLGGANGSGKTTLFSLIMGLHTPANGEIEIFGTRCETQNDFREVREKIGFLFQDADNQLFCPTVAEDIAFGPLNLGKTREEAQKITLQILEELGLQGFEDRVTYNLSGGEKRLVSIATVLAMEPKILLLDEPTTGLDEKTTIRIIDILKSLSISYIIVSHDKQFLHEVVTSSKIIRNGKIETVNTTRPY